MEVGAQNVLNFSPQAAFTALSILTNSDKNYYLQEMYCENLFEICLKFE